MVASSYNLCFLWLMTLRRHISEAQLALYIALQNGLQQPSLLPQRQSRGFIILLLVKVIG